MTFAIVHARSRADLSAAPMFALIKAAPGLVPRLARDEWAVFFVDGTTADDDVRAEAERRGLPPTGDFCPLRDDENAPAEAGDWDAALSYLAEGPERTLVKLPDELADTHGNRWFRLYVPKADEPGAQREAVREPGSERIH